MIVTQRWMVLSNCDKRYVYAINSVKKMLKFVRCKFLEKQTLNGKIKYKGREMQIKTKNALFNPFVPE